MPLNGGAKINEPGSLERGLSALEMVGTEYGRALPARFDEQRPRIATSLNILLFAKIPARKGHLLAVTFVASGGTRKCGPDRLGRRGDGGNDRDRCLSREGERRFRSYLIYLNTSIKNY